MSERKTDSAGDADIGHTIVFAGGYPPVRAIGWPQRWIG